GGASAADQVRIQVTLDGAPAGDATRNRTAGASSNEVELQLGSYRAGGLIAVAATALAKGHPIGSGNAKATLDSGCSVLDLSIAGGAVDAGNFDREDLGAIASDGGLDAGPVDGGDAGLPL